MNKPNPSHNFFEPLFDVVFREHMPFFSKTKDMLVGFGFQLNAKTSGFHKDTFRLFYIDRLIYFDGNYLR